jgi:hypothetical protein
MSDSTPDATDEQPAYESPDDLIEAWQEGDLDLDDADTINSIDGFTLEVKFQAENGSLILTYSLNENLAYRIEGGDSEQISLTI